MSARALSATQGTTSTTAAGNFPGQRLLLGYTKAVCVANDVMEELSLYIHVSGKWEMTEILEKGLSQYHHSQLTPPSV